MPELPKRHSPHGQPIRVRHHDHALPGWVKSRRRAYHLIDSLADAAKHAIRQMVPRPRTTSSAHG